jgi:hypothetical protein
MGMEMEMEMGMTRAAEGASDSRPVCRPENAGPDRICCGSVHSTFSTRKFTASAFDSS